MPPGGARTADGITDCIHDSLHQPDLQSRRVRLTSPVLQAAALAGINYPLLPLFTQSPHQPFLQEGGPAPTAAAPLGLILHQVSVPLRARSPMGSFCRAPTSYRGCFSPPRQHRQLQALLSTLEKPAGGAADKEALRLPDKAARHLWGSAGTGSPGKRAEGDPPGTERWEAQGHRPQRRRAQQTVLCSSASALPAGDRTCLPREPEEKPGPPPFPLMCARHVGAAGARGGRDVGTPWSLAVIPPRRSGILTLLLIVDANSLAGPPRASP